MYPMWLTRYFCGLYIYHKINHTHRVYVTLAVFRSDGDDLNNKTHGIFITGYGSTLYIGIAMVFVFSPYIWKFTFCFRFQVNLTFNDFIAQTMSKVICVPNISLNYHFLA